MDNEIRISERQERFTKVAGERPAHRAGAPITCTEATIACAGGIDGVPGGTDRVTGCTDRARSV